MDCHQKGRRDGIFPKKGRGQDAKGKSLEVVELVTEGQLKVQKCGYGHRGPEMLRPEVELEEPSAS